MPRLLIVAATGSGDHTRASVPFHIAVNGAVGGGVECGVALAGDAAELLKPQVMDQVRGLGIPPLRELIEKCRAQGVSFYV